MSEMSQLCAEPTCRRVAPRSTPRASRSDQRCTRHDGQDHGRGICECQLAVAGKDGQCIRCWHPIVRLHPHLAGLLERVPWLADQEFEL